MLPEHDYLYRDQYKVVAGSWPKNRFECVLVLTSHGYVTDLCLYALGLKDPKELDKMIRRYAKGETVESSGEPGEYKYDDFIGIKLKLALASDFYEYDSKYKIYVDKTDNRKYMLDKIRHGKTLTITGVVQPTDPDSISMLQRLRALLRSEVKRSLRPLSHQPLLVK